MIEQNLAGYSFRLARVPEEPDVQRCCRAVHRHWRGSYRCGVQRRECTPAEAFALSGR
jgi:hypothetical protein